MQRGESRLATLAARPEPHTPREPTTISSFASNQVSYGPGTSPMSSEDVVAIGHRSALVFRVPATAPGLPRGQLGREPRALCAVTAFPVLGVCVAASAAPSRGLSAGIRPALSTGYRTAGFTLLDRACRFLAGALTSPMPKVKIQRSGCIGFLCTRSRTLRNPKIVDANPELHEWHTVTYRARMRDLQWGRTLRLASVAGGRPGPRQS